MSRKLIGAGLEDPRDDATLFQDCWCWTLWVLKLINSFLQVVMCRVELSAQCGMLLCGLR